MNQGGSWGGNSGESEYKGILANPNTKDKEILANPTTREILTNLTTARDPSLRQAAYLTSAASEQRFPDLRVDVL